MSWPYICVVLYVLLLLDGESHWCAQGDGEERSVLGQPVHRVLQSHLTRTGHISLCVSCDWALYVTLHCIVTVAILV